MFDHTKLPSPKGQIELIDTIGKGNFGYVYRGKLLASKEISAIKVVKIKQEELREILLEVEILSDCKNENIVQFMGCFYYKNDLWVHYTIIVSCFLFELMFDLYGVLWWRCRRFPIQKPFTDEEVGVFIFESLKGLQYLHQKHIIHRDIKSGNLLLTTEGEVKLADFGVSAVTTAATSYRAHSFIGTPYWMAPEVIMSENSPTHMYDCKADIWSIGITTIELADKSPPLSDIHPMRALYLIPAADPATINVRNPKNWSKSFVSFIQACIVKDPRKRPSADEILKHPFMDHINSLGDGRRVVVTKLSAAVKDEKRKRTEKSNKKTSQLISQEEEDSDEASFQGFDQSNEKKKDSNLSTVTPIEVVVSAPSGPPSLVKDGKKTPNLSTSPSVTSFENSSGSRSNSSLSPLKNGLMNAFRRRTRSIGEEPLEVETDTLNHELLDITSLLGFQNSQNPSKEPGLFVPGQEANMKQQVLSVAGHLENTKLADTIAIVPFSLVSLDLNLKFEILCADCITLSALDSQGTVQTFNFLLLGTEKGLLVSDISLHHDPKGLTEYNYVHPRGKTRTRLLIPDVRFKQIHVLEDYQVVLGLAGKTNRIRAYQLCSLKRLIRYTYGLASIPSGKDESDEERLMPEHNEEEIPETPQFWTTDFMKILGTKETLAFVVTRTQETIYVGAIFKNSITVFEWAKLPYLRFMKVKDFWVPEAPRSIHLLHDGKFITDLIIIYEREANYIEFESSQVKEIKVIDDIKNKLPKDVLKDKEQALWNSWTQLTHVFEGVKKEEQKNVIEVKSWYDTIRSMKPSNKNNLLSEKSPRTFMATYGNQTRIVDEYGNMKTDQTNCSINSSISWGKLEYESRKAEDPICDTAPVRTVLLNNDVVSGIHKNYMEMVDAKTGKVIQAIKSSSSLKLLIPMTGMEICERRRGRVYMCTFNKKKKVTQIYWLRENGYDYTQVETDRAHVDKVQKSSKVLGTGTVLKGNHTFD